MLLLSYCIFFVLFALSSTAPNDFIIVPTPNGLVQGVESITENHNTFYAFRGIRYGKAPINNLRFRAPVPVQPWFGVYNATKHGNVCVQSFVDNSTEVIGDEDCLFVNVYTTQLPDNTSKKRLLPVLVWIHGGGFIFGFGNLDLHGADRFLDQGVVVVSLNYRLGVFGFLSTEDSIVPGNYGIKDQVLALQWVQKNIASFGGDPTQVTIFGQSAGAASVSYLHQAKLAKGLFKRAIANSGSTLNPWSITRNASDSAFFIGLLNGIFTTVSTILVRELRKVKAANLQRSTISQSYLDLIDILNELPFAPVIEKLSAEAVYTSNSFVALDKGNFNRVPLLQGFTSLEGRQITESPLSENLLHFGQYDADPCRLTPTGMNANKKDKKIVGQYIRSYYMQNKSVTITPGFINYFSDNEFVRGIVKSSQLASRFNDVYLYRFSFTGGAVHSNVPPEGVNHAEELQFLWLTPDWVQKTPEAQLTVERMVQMWSNFVKTGNPTPCPSAAVNVIWPLVNANGDNEIHYLDIGEELVPLVNPQQEQMQFWEDLFTVYGNPPYNTY